METPTWEEFMEAWEEFYGTLSTQQTAVIDLLGSMSDHLELLRTFCNGVENVLDAFLQDLGDEVEWSGEALHELKQFRTTARMARMTADNTDRVNAILMDFIEARKQQHDEMA
jgi:hypothetical protein